MRQRSDLYHWLRQSEERLRRGYRRGQATEAECQYAACVAAIARYRLELKHSEPPRRGRKVFPQQWSTSARLPRPALCTA